MSRARIIGIGSYAPQRILTNRELEKMVDTSDEWIVQRTGIRERRIVDEGYSGAQQIISGNLDRLHDLAHALLEHETLTGEEVSAVLRGDPLPKAPPQEPPSATAPSGRRGSVPTTAPPKDEAGGMEPSPQPGA